MKDLLLADAGAQVVDGVADDEGQENLDGVVEQDSDPTPGEMFPVALEVGCEWFETVEHKRLDEG